MPSMRHCSNCAMSLRLVIPESASALIRNPACFCSATHPRCGVPPLPGYAGMDVKAGFQVSPGSSAGFARNDGGNNQIGSGRGRATLPIYPTPHTLPLCFMSRFEGWLRFATAAENDPGAGDSACRSGCPACPRKRAQKLVHCALVALNGDTATRFSALPAADSPQMGMRLPPESEKAFRPASGPSAAPSRPCRTNPVSTQTCPRPLAELPQKSWAMPFFSQSP